MTLFRVFVEREKRGFGGLCVVAEGEPSLVYFWFQQDSGVCAGWKGYMGEEEMHCGEEEV